jgi:ubiquinone/menaquinone biosynthesis C-methylase UbiE
MRVIRHRLAVRACSVALALLLSFTAGPSGAAQTDSGVHPVSGRRIAQVMGHAGAAWLDRPERVSEEQPERALAAIGVDPGHVVADVGAGSGYYTVRLARRVGPGGTVYATDIQPEMLALLAKRVKRERLDNVVPVLATSTDPKLPDAALDLVLMVDVYHELSQPQETLRRLKRTLRPRGRLVLIEFRKEDPRVPIRPEHKMSVDEARLELEAEGFRLVKVSEVLPWQHILVFEPN